MRGSHVATRSPGLLKQAGQVMKSTVVGLGVLLALAGGSIARAADAPAPVTVDLWPGEAPGEVGNIAPETTETKGGIARVSNVSHPTMTVFRPEASKNTGAAVLILPGGGYNILAIDHEGDQVAKYLNGIGVTGVVLKYRVPRRQGTANSVPPPQALMDAQRALGMVRSHAKDWEIDPSRVGILGFSAGGHLAAWASASPGDRRSYDAIDAADKLSARPDFTVLIYPAYLLKKGADSVTPEIPIDAEYPPTFFAMAGDDAITVDGSLALYKALKGAKVPAELHVYASGGHGFGMKPTETPSAAWPDRLAEWMKARGWLKPAA